MNKLDSFKAGVGETEWNTILRVFESYLGALPITAIVVGNTLTCVFPGNVATPSGEKIDLPTKIHAGAR